MQISVRADVVRAKAFFKELKAKEIDSAAANAINILLRAARNESIKKVAEVRKVRPSLIRASIQIAKRASFWSPQGEVRATGKPISLREYSAKQTSTGVTVNVMGQAKEIRSAFGPGILGRITQRFIYTQNGKRRQSVERDAGPNPQIMGGHVFVRLGRARLPIRQLYGPSIPTGFIRDEVRDAQERVIEVDWPKEIAKQINAALVKLRARHGG
jgi:hypothetical protein